MSLSKSLLLAAALAIGAVSQTPSVAAERAAPAQPRSEVVYQIFVRSYRDSNGDRIGDLQGVRRSLDYLSKLGVTSILLTPIQPSHFYHNYFASSFEGVDPAFGDMKTFRALVKDLHARGMKIYLDQEIQYVVADHPWWKLAQGDPSSPYSNWVLYDGPGNTRPETGFLNLTSIPGWDGKSYGFTTVNLKNPEVRAYFERLFAGWAKDGVDGFRIDHMMDDLDGKPKLKGLFADFWAPVFARARAVNPKLKIIAEQADWGYGDDWLTRGGVDMVFAFPIRQAIVSLDKAKIIAAIEQTQAKTPAGKGQLIFIENHDVSRFASEVGSDPRKERIGAALNLFLKGTPLIYYGQELGMRGEQSHAWGTDANDIPDREAFRWTADLQAPGSAVWYAGDHPWWTDRFNRSGDGVSVEEEAANPRSLLADYRRLIALRRERPELRAGEETIVCREVPGVLCIERAKGAARSVLAVNLTAAQASLPLAAIGAGLHWKSLLGQAPREVGADGVLRLQPYETVILGAD